MATCAQDGCDEVITPRTHGGGMPKLFCSQRCRDRSKRDYKRQWQSDHREQYNTRAQEARLRNHAHILAGEGEYRRTHKEQIYAKHVRWYKGKGASTVLNYYMSKGYLSRLNQTTDAAIDKIDMMLGLADLFCGDS